MNCNTSRFGSKVIHRTAFGTDVSIPVAPYLKGTLQIRRIVLSYMV